MKNNIIEDMKEREFDGFLTIEHAMSTNCSDVPKIRGVYCVLYPDAELPEFLQESVGGHFKGRNPTVSLEKLRSNWIQGAYIIYIGKAGGENSKATLRSRFSQYMKFGQGEPIGHWGGRLIWQIKGNRNLLMCWKSTPSEEPREVEKALIGEFRDNYGNMPFANLAG